MCVSGIKIMVCFFWVVISWVGLLFENWLNYFMCLHTVIPLVVQQVLFWFSSRILINGKCSFGNGILHHLAMCELPFQDLLELTQTGVSYLLEASGLCELMNYHLSWVNKCLKCLHVFEWDAKSWNRVSRKQKIHFVLLKNC